MRAAAVATQVSWQFQCRQFSLITLMGSLAVVVASTLACGPSGSAGVRPILQDPVDGKSDGVADANHDTPAPPGEPITPSGDPTPDAASPALDAASPEQPTQPPASDAGTDAGPPKRPAGEACASPLDCATGFCVDRVCCATACTGRCFICNRQGSVGSCSAVPTGEDPRNECTADAVTTCARDGTCDGNGGCRLYPSKTECEPAGCFGATMEKSARLCDGNGVCQPNPMTRVCTAATCQNGSCGTACTSSTNCLPGFHCDGNVCRVKKALGEVCTATGQCASNNCVGGVCCDTACDKACFSCKLPSKPGTCLPAPNGEDPGEKCSAEAASTCGRDGACDGSGACRAWGAGTACGPAACAAGAATSGRACDGQGTCSAATRTDCGAFACDGDKCGTTCTANPNCAPGFYCSSNTCVPQALAVRWSFEEDMGTVAKDVSGNGRDGTYVGPTPSTEVPVSLFPNTRSRSFAAKQVVHLAPMPAVFNTITALTISVFYKSGPPPAGGDGSELVSLADNHLLRLLKGGGFEVTKRTGEATPRRHKCVSMLGAVTIDNKWHHVAATIDNTGIKLYFDGALQTCTPNGIPPTTTLGFDIAGNFTAGRHGLQPPQTPYDFVGNLDEVRLYWRALSAAEITELARGGL